MIRDVLNRRGEKAIASLPTGAGKTRTAVEALTEWLGSDPRGPTTTVLWLAHTEELCEQACECFRQVWVESDARIPLQIVRKFGGHQPDLERFGTLQVPMVVVTTAAALDHVAEAFVARKKLKRILIKLGDEATWTVRQRQLADRRELRAISLAATAEAKKFFADIAGQLGAIVIDEAHRAAASGYKAILKWAAALPSRPSVVGLTATPFRSGGDDATRELSRLFDGRLLEPPVLGTEPRSRLQEMGVLAHPVVDNLESGVAIRRLPAAVMQYDRVMGILVDTRKRRARIVKHIAAILEAEPSATILYFGPSVADARAVAILLRMEGHLAQALSGETRREVRRSVVRRFRDGEVRVLCNCELLTTGFDAPRVSHVVVGRPTTSQVLYEQMVGRGLRGPAFGGTEVCTIVDVVDDFTVARPALGFEAFREHWVPRRNASR